MPTDPLPPELNELVAAAAGLLYPSETDAPFDVFCWTPQGDDPEAEIRLHVHEWGDVERVTPEAFFAELRGDDNAARFEKLRRALKSTVFGLAVYRIGRVTVDIFLIGRTRNGNWAGVHTVSVET